MKRRKTLYKNIYIQNFFGNKTPVPKRKEYSTRKKIVLKK